jgi:alkylation response protein AidB-like acyl-CoA dehydrogenase
MGDSSTIDKLAAGLEQHLGDPTDPATGVSFAVALDHDDREEYPHSMMAALHAWDLQDYQVPVSHGGRATDLQDSFELLRLISRRDAALATSFATTSLSLMPVLIAGDDEQKSRYGTDVSRGAKFSWGLSERAHGSDVIATETNARRVPGGYVVNGEKWPIGNAALGDVAALFVRTGERPGPTAYSVHRCARSGCTGCGRSTTAACGSPSASSRTPR